MSGVLTHISLFTRDVQALPDFYAALFGLEEIEAVRSHRYRELSLGPVKLCFPYVDAYETLEMSDQADPTGVRSLVTFAVETPAEVDRLSGLAAERGGRVAKAPFVTGWGQYLAIVLDPEGNAVRISAKAV